MNRYRLTVYLTEDVYKQVLTLAQQQGRSISNEGEQLIKIALDKSNR